MLSVIINLWRKVNCIIYPALQVQIVPAIGYLLTVIVSLFYFQINDPRFPIEAPWIILVGFIISLLCWIVGSIGMRGKLINTKLNLLQGAWVVLLTWVLACSISSLVFMLSGFPVPDNVEAFSLLRKFIDGFYESMSGFTTTGTSILPSVEAFPRSILFWRSLTHWIGGMGIAYMAISIFKHFKTRRAEIINNESESPHIIEFKDEKSAIESGIEFLKAYSILTVVCFVCLLFSGHFFREVPYERFYDNVFDATTITFGTLGTGGFSVYNASIGLPVEENGKMVIGGLRNPTSEWIIGFFMFFASMNFALWYTLLFQGNLKTMLKNKELRAFSLFVLITTISITAILTVYRFHPTILESLRYAFFNVTTIISTTGFGTDDFDGWPLAAQGVLFSCYLVGACVGSTGGGIKFTRFLVLFKYMGIQLKTLIYGGNKTTFQIDNVNYNDKSAGIIITNIVIYFMIFLFGAILIMLTGSKAIFTDGSIRELDFVSAFTASIANLGNIGPAIVNGSVGHGPTGNYSAYTDIAKIIMATLMFVGRIGVLTCFMLFLTKEDYSKLHETRSHVDFDGDAPTVFGR